jgi:hypothetical protein
MIQEPGFPGSFLCFVNLLYAIAFSVYSDACANFEIKAFLNIRICCPHLRQKTQLIQQ